MDDAIPPPETAEEREARLAWERAALDVALQEVAAGQVLDGDEVLAWFLSLGTADELPEPQPIDPSKRHSR